MRASRDYGIDHIKVHSKLCQITYLSDGEVRYITQIGTGNYNEKTSKLYTDLSLMTADQKIGEEAAEVFQKLCLAQTMDQTKYSARGTEMLTKQADRPDQMKRLRKQKEGKEAYIGVKINSLTDKKLIEKLIEASMAGVQIDLIVRGICCLIPGIKGYTGEYSGDQHRGQILRTFQNLHFWKRRGLQGLYCICRLHDEEYDKACRGRSPSVRCGY